MLESNDKRAAGAWLDMAHGKAARWGDIFDSYASIASFPAWAFYRELIQRYPEARVVLTVRDANTWFEDINAGDLAAYKTDPWWLFRVRPIKKLMKELEDLVIIDRMYRGQLDEKHVAIAAFEDHTNNITNAVPPDRLLIFDVKDGWGPLCAFLGVGVPEGLEFPWLNDIPSVKRRLRKRYFLYRGIEVAVTVTAAVLLVSLIF